MEPRQNTQSVMARLMGLDELPQPKRLALKPQQVISETYLQRVASIGAGKKRLCRERYSFGKCLEKDNESKVNSGLSLHVKPQNSSELQGSSELAGSKSDRFRYCNPKKKSLSTRDLHGLQRNLAHSGNTKDSKSQCTSVCRNVDILRKPRRRSEFGYLEPLRKLESSERYFSSANSRSGVDNRAEYSNPVDWRVGVEQKKRNTVGCDVKSVGLSPVSREILEELSRRTRRRVTKDPSLGFRVSDTCAIKRELSIKQVSERCSKARNIGEVGPASKALYVSRPRNHMLGNGWLGRIKDIDRRSLSKQLAKYEAFRSKWNLKSGKPLNWARINLRKHERDEDGSEPKNTKLKLDTSESLPCVNSDTKDDKRLQDTRARKDEENNKPGGCSLYEQNMILSNPSTSSVESVSTVEDMVMDSRTEVSAIPSEKYENEHLEDDDRSGRATDSSAQQEASIGLDEDHATFSRCSRMELDSLVILEETYQPSPISVLEQPFSEEAINDSEFLRRVKDDIYDLGLQLELLRSETSETHSEGPGIAVSSDDKCEEAYIKIHGVEEGKNFLYLVAVIMKASLHGKNLADFASWDSLETPISLSVFETLKKKYCDRVSWKRSERRLLFDRVNAGLVEILSPRVGVPAWQNPMSRRFSALRGNEMIEEDLWRLLVSQDKKCGSKENVLGSEFGKLELGDEIGAIGLEIERLLFDELLAEFFY